MTPEGWSARDELVHVAAWLEDCARVLGLIGAGTLRRRDGRGGDGRLRGPGERGATPSGRRTMPAAAARSVLGEARVQARDAFAALEEVDALAWGWFEESGPLHYAKHGHDLAAWAAGSRSDPEVGPLLQEETDAWIVFVAALDGVPVTAPVDAPPGWSVADVGVPRRGLAGARRRRRGGRPRMDARRRRPGGRRPERAVPRRGRAPSTPPPSATGWSARGPVSARPSPARSLRAPRRRSGSGPTGSSTTTEHVDALRRSAG